MHLVFFPAKVGPRRHHAVLCQLPLTVCSEGEPGALFHPLELFSPRWVDLSAAPRQLLVLHGRARSFFGPVSAHIYGHVVNTFAPHVSWLSFLPPRFLPFLLRVTHSLTHSFLPSFLPFPSLTFSPPSLLTRVPLLLCTPLTPLLTPSLTHILALVLALFNVSSFDPAESVSGYCSTRALSSTGWLHAVFLSAALRRRRRSSALDYQTPTFCDGGLEDEALGVRI
ncbi:hypothetical protein Mp_2g06770 [Marchantia polymorpha subsp. ruderalis]|uniref:Uncharacterized protein n=1 Tax=Marchantia polymorpha TaxID=3197 RepID=A0A2R6XDU7_MARPO|nr:hypothetical protein MARPO_0021s0130 [Marchantia polymorpha]BBN01350.1 hypothetical protein Mp_2g06770 [Marchantia polymorpha subsp. ruderalis]|eukprot:PTQ44276.1 hypothetical protein MARPO_0021s0130 [Marchantia polymorpha]